jgi:hypothetical protein
MRCMHLLFSRKIFSLSQMLITKLKLAKKKIIDIEIRQTAFQENKFIRLLWREVAKHNLKYFYLYLKQSVIDQIQIKHNLCLCC